MVVVGSEVVLKRTWAPAIATDRFHTDSSVATGIVTANAGRPFVTGARDGESDLKPKGVYYLDLGTP